MLVLGEQLLQQCSEFLLGAVGGGDEAIQLAQLEKEAEGADASDTVLLKDQVQSQEQALEQSKALGRLEENALLGGRVVALLALFPVMEGGVGDTSRLGSLSGGGRGGLGVEAVVEDLDGLGAWVAKRLFRGCWL
jgi:hypothetical protein